jgi:hypothetical protein
MALHAATSSPVLPARGEKQAGGQQAARQQAYQCLQPAKAVPSQQQPNLRTVLGSGAGLQQHAQVQSADTLLSLLTAGCR